MSHQELHPAPPITPGVEDRFHFVISEDACTHCGACEKTCPTGSIIRENGRLTVNAETCIDCGTCSAVCPTGAAHSPREIRESPRLGEIDPKRFVFNPGCAMTIYKPDLPALMYGILRDHYGEMPLLTTCCRHDAGLPEGTVVINNCAGCDRRYRSLYKGVQTISYWEVIDCFDDLALPDYHGQKISVHDSCSYRHKPQVHAAIRSLLRKMNFQIVEAKHHGTESICCGDNLYGSVPNHAVEDRIRMRAAEFPCPDVAVTCIGCERAFLSAGLTPRYLPDLLFGRSPREEADSLDTYHDNISCWIDEH